MNKIFTLSIFFLLSFATYSQTYSYSFSGQLNPENITAYEKECLKFKQVASVKIKYKPDSQKGEMIIIVNQYPEGTKMEGKEQFQPTDIKNFLLSKGLNPIQFRELKK